MASNDLALSWRDHHNVLISVFENLLEKKALVDCTLAAEGEFLKAHKIVLSACSPYLETLLNQENDKHPIIFLRDVNFQDLKALVEFVYSGEIKIPENRLVEFLNVAEALQIKGLGGAQNETREKKQDAETVQQRKLVPKKRLRRDSNNSESNSRDRYDTSSCSLPPRKVKCSKEGQIKFSDTNNTGASSQETVVAREDLQEEIPEVKKEVVNPTCAESTAVDVEQSIPDSVPTEVNELPELKPEFEQVTFTEEFSEDMLPEDDDATEAVVNPAHDETSNSYHYSGFSSEPFDTGGIAAQNQCVEVEGEQPISEGYGHIVSEWSASERDTVLKPANTFSSGDAVMAGNSCGSSTVEVNSLQPEIFLCSSCPKSFRTQYLLRTHEEMHSPKRQYNCTYCSSTFTESGSLSNSLQTQSREQHVCPHCSENFSYLRRILEGTLERKP